jgi:hypothetical protein
MLKQNLHLHFRFVDKLTKLDNKYRNIRSFSLLLLEFRKRLLVIITRFGSSSVFTPNLQELFLYLFDCVF